MRIAVVGAGLMGTAIAYVFAAAGHSVSVHDPNGKALARVPGECARISALRREPEVSTSLCGELRDAVVDAGLVIEAAPEDPDLKKRIFTQLAEHTDPKTILATNTSAIPIRELAAVTDQPERVVGTHFWNPPYAVRLVEVVQAPATADAVVTATMEILAGAGMRPVHVKRDVPGFVGNRLQHALKREAIALIATGVCDAETIDTVTKLGFGARLAVLGPMEQSDLVGLDLTQAIHRTLIPDLDTTATVHPLLESLVERGDLGMKTGRGFRTWTPEEAQRVRDRLEEFLLSDRRE